MLIKECHLEKSCYFKDRANQGCVNQGITVLFEFPLCKYNRIGNKRNYLAVNQEKSQK